MNRQKRLRLVLLRPKMPVRLQRGAGLDIEVGIVASGLAECRLELRYDHAALTQAGAEADHREIALGDVAGNVSWHLRAVRPTMQTYVVIEAQGGGLIQRIEFPVEVLP